MTLPRVEPPPNAAQAYRCRCGSPVFFRNSVCLTCGVALGYEPESAQLIPFEPGSSPDVWIVSKGDAAVEYKVCANLELSSGCNWLIPTADPNILCRACRLNRTIPNLGAPENHVLWRKVEVAKRQLAASLLILGLPLRSKVEDPVHGLAFDFLLPQPGCQPVVTGHEDGVITLNLDEADDAKREQMRLQMGEHYRTLLGHFRHEIGHYYWDLLVDRQPSIDEFRQLFGDETQDYQTALNNYYANGPAPNWPLYYISAYASSHPWEDWAETWAHYLHMTDSLRSVGTFGVTIAASDLFECFDGSCLDPAPSDLAPPFLDMVNSWTSLTAFSNELMRGMGHPDFYPFVLSRAAVAKLYFVHRLIHAPLAA